MEVAECYIRVRYPRLSRDAFDELSEHLLGVATDLSRAVERGREMDYLLEEGTLWQRVKIAGGILLGVYTAAAQYHDFRKSLPCIIQDGQMFSSHMIDEFHKIRGTEPTDTLYKRTVSRDMNRLRRIVLEFDKASDGRLPPAEITEIRNRIIHDLARLVRANPNDPEIAALIDSLPGGPIRDLPHTPRNAIKMDVMERGRRSRRSGDFELEAQEPRPARVKRRRRFERRVPLAG